MLTCTQSDEWLITALISRWAAAASLVLGAGRQMFKEQGDIMCWCFLRFVSPNLFSYPPCPLFAFQQLTHLFITHFNKICAAQKHGDSLLMTFSEGCPIHAQHETSLLSPDCLFCLVSVCYLNQAMSCCQDNCIYSLKLNILWFVIELYSWQNLDSTIHFCALCMHD